MFRTAIWLAVSGFVIAMALALYDNAKGQQIWSNSGGFSPIPSVTAPVPTLTPDPWDFNNGVRLKIIAGASHDVYVIYGGWNLRTTVGAVEAKVATAVASVPGAARCIVLGVPTFNDTTDYTSSATHAAVDTINFNLMETYGMYFQSPNNCVFAPFKEYGILSSNTISEVTTMGADVMPPSVVGGTTVTAGGATLLTTWVNAIITEKGW